MASSGLDGSRVRGTRGTGTLCMRTCSVGRGDLAAEPIFASPRRVRVPFLLLLSVSLSPVVNGCSGSSDVGPGLGARTDTYDQRWGVSSSARVVHAGPVPKGGGTHKLGRPYQVGGRWYVPRHEPGYDRVGIGSWYGQQFHGRKTANGEIFDMDALTAAHPTLPIPSYAYVTNLRNGRTLLVRINDRGPYVADRVIDLSRASARALGYFDGGLARVRVRWAGHAPLDGNDRREQAFLREQPWNGGGRLAHRDEIFEAPAPRYEAPPQRQSAYDRSSQQQTFAAAYGRRPAYANDEDRRTVVAPREQLPWARDDSDAGRESLGAGSSDRRIATYDDGSSAAGFAEPQERDARDAGAGAAAQSNEMWSPFEHRSARRR